MLQVLVHFAELGLGAGARALEVLVGFEHACHHRRDVLHVEVQGEDEEHDPHHELEDAAEPRTATLRVQHFIILPRET